MDPLFTPRQLKVANKVDSKVLNRVESKSTRLRERNPTGWRMQTAAR